ncbi:MAG: cob(I)yrinic acid a,c-diamide adenosyltransferase [Dehalococcoidia bacterium]
MRVYTRTGDDGQTGLFGGPRVAKDDPRLEAYGTVDELNSTIGVAGAFLDHEDLRAWLQVIQSDLFDVGGELATPDLEERIRKGQPVGPRVTAEDVTKLEGWIDAMDTEIEPLTRFILPGGTPASAHLHVARTVCRRAERRVLSLSRTIEVAPTVIRYLNRLSDCLFTMARVANARAGVAEPAWLGRDERSS